MGYYSDVGLCLSAAGKTALDTVLLEAKKNNPDVADIQALLDHAKVITGAASGTVAYCWKSTKWYDDFAEVRFIEALMQTLDSSDFLFIRVGDDSDDTELRGGFWGNPLGMRLSRGIVLE